MKTQTRKQSILTIHKKDINSKHKRNERQTGKSSILGLLLPFSLSEQNWRLVSSVRTSCRFIWIPSCSGSGASDWLRHTRPAHKNTTLIRACDLDARDCSRTPDDGIVPYSFLKHAIYRYPLKILSLSQLNCSCSFTQH